MLTPQLLLYLPQITGVFVIAVLVLANQDPNRRNKLFALPMFLMAGWLGAQLAAQVSPDPVISHLFVEMSVALSCFLAVSYVVVIKRYLRIKSGMFLDAGLIAFAAVVAIMALTGQVVYKTTSDISGISIDDASPLYFVTLIFILLVFSTALTMLYRATRRLPKGQRFGNYVLFVSSLQMVVLSGVGSLFFAHVAAAQVLIFASALAYCIGIFFGIARHGLFDVRLIAVRSLGYFMSLVTLAVVYVVIAYVVSRLFFQTSVTTGVSFSPVNIGLALVLAFIFQPVKNFFDKITNGIFYRDRYNSEEFFALLSNVLGTTTDLRDLLERAADIVGMTLKSGQSFFFVRQRDGTHMVAGLGVHEHLLVSEAAHLDEYVKKVRQRIVVAENIVGHHSIFSILKRRKIALLLPLFHGDGIVGYLALGEQLGGRYTRHDLRVLETIADELVIAVQNAMSLEEVREINATLQDKIDGATRDLRSKNERLRQLDNTKDEFISMASHQLRTPLTSVKGYVSMILDGDAGPVTDAQRRFLEEAFDSSVRMAGIIGDFLNVSRLQTGKFMLEKTQVDLADIAASEVEHLQNAARMRGLKIVYKKPKNFPAVMADKSKIEQVMMNFMDNALFYAPNSKTVDVSLTHDGGKAVFTVRDHGIGVPKSEQAGLFTKFFRATNARRQRPDGTGVGIFLAKKVVTAHHGEIIFESEEGKGSTFGFSLPLLRNESAAVTAPVAAESAPQELATAAR